MTLPDGYGHVPGRSSVKAIKLLKIAEDLGLEPSAIHGVTGGYDVPTAVLDEYDKHLDAEDEASFEPTAADQSFQRIETNHTPLTFDTTHDEEPSVDETTVSASAEQTGISMEPTMAEGERVDDKPARRTTVDKHDLAGADAPVVDPAGSKVPTESERIKAEADAERAREEQEEAAVAAEKARREALTDEERAAEDAAAAEAANETPAPADEPELKAPAKSASKGDWVDYAVRVSNPSTSDAEAALREQLEAKTKDELITEFGA